MKVLMTLEAALVLVLLSGCWGEDSTADEASDQPQAVEPVPFGKSGHFGGTADPTFPAGEPGALSVVGVSELRGTNQLDFVLAFRNNTDQTMGEERLRVVFEKDGRELESTYTLPTSPAQLAPGEVGLVSVAFVPKRIRPGDLGSQGIEVMLEPNESLSPNEPHAGQKVPLVIEDSTNERGRITATATNRSGHGIGGPFTMMTYCFSDGLPVRAWMGMTYDVPVPVRPLADGDRFVFDMGHAVKGCQEYAVTVHGSRT